MDLSKLHRNVKLQTKGIWHDILNPATALPTGIRVKIIGPDSPAQKQLRFDLEDWLNPRSERYSSRNQPRNAKEKDEKIVEFLADTIIDWEVFEDGKPVPITKEAKIRVINAATWLRAQIDTLANYTPAWSDPDIDGDLEREEILEKARLIQAEMEQSTNSETEQAEADAPA